MKKSFFPISFILLALCFLPALCLALAHHDNTRFFDKLYAPASSNPDHRDPQYFLTYLIGRPLTGEIQQIIYTHVFHIQDLSTARWLVVFVFAICSGLLANIFCSFGLSSLASLLLSVSIFILPGVQDAVIMTALQNALAVWAALWAYLVSCRKGKSFIDDIFNSAVFFCLMLSSMFMYPQWSFFLFVPVLVKYLLDPKALPTVRKEILQLLVLFGVTAVFYFIYIKIFIMTGDTGNGAYSFTINFNSLCSKIQSVFIKILPMSFNFWNIYTNIWLGFVLMGLTIILLKKRAILCFILIGLTLCLWLLAPTKLILHRIFYVTSVMASAAFLISLRSQFMVTIIVILGLLGVNEVTYFNALNYNIEFSYIKQTLLNQRDFSRVHVIQTAPNGKGYNGFETIDDDFNDKTASYYFGTDMLHLLRAALKENHLPDSVWIYPCEKDQKECVRHMPVGYKLLVTHSNKGGPVYYSPDMVTIDMNNL